MVVATVVVGDGPSDVEVSAGGTQGYVPNAGSNTVSVVAVGPGQSV
jgi:DNA-binding beta-propeller fold protein YncE